VSGGTLRVWVFVDAQNVYKDARRAFFQDTDPSNLGQVDHAKLATLLAERGIAPPGKTRVLEECRVYVGIPSSDRDPRANAARLRQKAAWEKSGAKVFGRPLQYPRDWPQHKEQEKGVDVALAVDFVINAARKNFDIGILVSTDTDLVPALEAGDSLYRAWGTPKIEVSSWKPSRKRLQVPGRPLWCHLLERADYELVKDETKYANKASQSD
jgi:hypothetical protein